MVPKFILVLGLIFSAKVLCKAEKNQSVPNDKCTISESFLRNNIKGKNQSSDHFNFILLRIENKKDTIENNGFVCGYAR